MVDIIVNVLEKHSLNLSEEAVQALAQEIADALQDSRHELWSITAYNFLAEVLHILRQDKTAMLEDTVERTELGNLIYKIEELLLKN